MAFTHTRLGVLTAVTALAFALAACGGSKSPTAASCAKSWNADANADQQAVLLAARGSDIILDGKFRVGTWPKSDENVPVAKGFASGPGFASKPSGEARVQNDSCVLVFPPTTKGNMAFVQSDDGSWKYVRDNTGSKFAAAARRELTGAKVATLDALGKVKVE